LAKGVPNLAVLRAAFGSVEDPFLFVRLDDAGVLADVRPRGDGVDAVVRIPTDEHPGRDELRDRLTAAATTAGVPVAVDVVVETMGPEEAERLGERLRELGGPPGDHGAGRRLAATRVLTIASGKGGVGKSTVAVNLAVALARTAHSVGLLDADVYGFSVPQMLGVARQPVVLGPTILPPVAHGVRCLSMGFFVDENRAVAWRGPMLHKALEQFILEVHWGDPEYLLIDMPPGTGDVALSVAQHAPGAELYIVTTPQPAAERVAQRAGALGRELRLPVRGVIENMSWFAAPDGMRQELFGAGGGRALAAELGVELLAQIPFDPEVRAGADEGRPAVVVDPGSDVARAFEALAARVVALGPARRHRRELTVT
jgi:ATP-binding protein involved in chromosome partitioning